MSDQAFEPVPGGWIYRAPNPRVFGEAPRYLVNDAQKAEIEAIVAPRRSPLVSVILIMGMVAWHWRFWLRGRLPTVFDLLGMIVLMAAPVLIGVPLSAWIQRRRVAAVLANLPLAQR
jgi:hypothetical protein